MMNILNTDSTIKKLQDLAKEWANQFGSKAPMNIRFGHTAGNVLTVNGTALCPISEINADAATYDVEFLFIPTASGSEYEIYLHCPSEGPCEIGYIKLISTVYCADSLKPAE